jgi:hypothetical protein
VRLTRLVRPLQGIYEQALKVQPDHVASLCDFAELKKDLGDGETVIVACARILAVLKLKACGQSEGGKRN